VFVKVYNSRHARGDVPALARAILDEMWEAGYDVTLRHDAAASRFSEADEGRAVELRLCGSARRAVPPARR
jgi:hypothetical protein